MGAFGFAVFRTCCGNSGINNRRMTRCSNDRIGKRDFLFAGFIAEDLIANGASPVCNIAVLRAGRCVCCGWHHGMTRCRDHLTGCEKCVADGAICIACVAVLRAGCSACIANLSRRMLAQRRGIYELDIINACFFTLISVLFCITEGEAYAVLAIESGNLNFRMTGLI